MSSPVQASAHIVAAIAVAEHASMHSCIMSMSMPIIASWGMDFIMSIIIAMVVTLSSAPPVGAHLVLPEMLRRVTSEREGFR